MAHPVETLEQFRALEEAASITSFNPDRVSHLIYVYQLHVSNSHVCRSCPTALTQARDAVRGLVARIRPEWEERIAEAAREATRQAVEDYKAGPDPSSSSVE